jgi:Polyketide cyclase / dehydrase and lipid transport
MGRRQTGPMERTVRASTAAPTERLFEVVADLRRYPEWLELVRRVEATDGRPDDPGPGPAFLVDLRAKVGPLARSKRLRMVRSELVDGERVRFERRELDDRSHSDWRLEVEVVARDGGSELVMHLHYGGQLWMRPLEPVLARQVEQGAERLRGLLAA